jgi:alcohol dehydrogenase class IV
VVKTVEDILKERNAYAATFYEIGQHAPIEHIRKGMQVLKESKADVIVSVGGGSPIDASKAIIYNLQRDTGGSFLSQIAIPTTLSAAEYTVSRSILSRDFQSHSGTVIDWGRFHK